MNQFERAKAKYEKKIQERPVGAPAGPVEKKEQPKARTVPVMKITVNGEIPLSFELHYSGTLLSSQVNEKGLRELFKKCLSPMGRLHDAPGSSN